MHHSTVLDGTVPHPRDVRETPRQDGLHGTRPPPETTRVRVYSCVRDLNLSDPDADVVGKNRYTAPRLEMTLPPHDGRGTYQSSCATYSRSHIP